MVAWRRPPAEAPRERTAIRIPLVRHRERSVVVAIGVRYVAGGHLAAYLTEFAGSTGLRRCCLIYVRQETHPASRAERGP